MLEQFIGIESVSTASVLAEAEDNDIDIVVINSKNAEIINSLQLSAADIQNIKNEVNAGNTVITPCQNISIGNWTGTGYIVEYAEQGNMAFKLSNGLNGGATTETVVPLMFIDSIVSGADIVISLTAIATSITALLAASAFLPALGAAVILIASFAALIATIDHIISVQEHWENALDGDQTAIEELKWECGFNFLFTAATFGLGKGASAVANKAASKTLTKYLGEEAGEVDKTTFKENLSAAVRFAKRAAKQGVDDVALHLLMESPDCLKYGDDVLKSLGKLEPLSQTKAAGVLKEHAGTLVNAFSKTEILDDAVKFIADYSDDGAKLLFRYGDDAIEALNYIPANKALVDDYSKYAIIAMKDYGILPQNIIKLEQQGIPPHIYNGKYDGYTITKGARDINSNDIAEKLIKMYEKIHSKFTEQELNEIRALAIKFEEKYKANVTKRTLSPAVAVAFYKDESKGIYRYSIAINYNPAKQGEKIVVKDLDESLQLKVNEIANNKTEIIYEGSHGEGSHAEVKAVNKIIKSLKDEGIEYNPDNVIVYVNSTHNVTSVPKEISFVRCPHCSYILDDFMALSDCEIVESGTKLRDNFFEEYNMNFGDKTLQKFELNKDICIEMASYESSDTAIILSPK